MVFIKKNTGFLYPEEGNHLYICRASILSVTELLLLCSANQVREKVGNDMMIGVSVHSVEEALEAVKNGADCLGAGSVFSTSTKANVSSLSKETLRDICNAVDIPVVAIGGINKTNIAELSGTGISGVALVSAIFAASDIEAECRMLRKASEEMLGA